MLRDGSLYIIDFQDARLGPDTYDSGVAVARFVRRHRRPRARRADCLFFWRSRKATAVRASDEEFRRRFDLMALQRNLKALGTFGYQTITRRNTVYIQYIPRTLRYARSNPREVSALRAAPGNPRRPRRRAVVNYAGGYPSATPDPLVEGLRHPAGDDHRRHPDRAVARRRARVAPRSCARPRGAREHPPASSPTTSGK